jgi:hypothetical protein
LFLLKGLGVERGVMGEGEKQMVVRDRLVDV